MITRTRLNPKQKCDSCGFTRGEHWGVHPVVEGLCTGFYLASGNEPPAPRAEEGEHSPLPWTDTGMHIKDARGIVVASVLSPLGKLLNEEIDANASLILEAVNQHATLVAQRDRLLEAIRDVAIRSLRYCEEKYGHDDQARLNLEALITTVEQEGKS